MRPVRFVALSEDGHAFVLADEVGRLLALPIDDRIQAAVRPERPGQSTVSPSPGQPADPDASLSPRDIQARIRAGESADEVARIAGVPVDRVLRYAGPVLQERAMLAQHARRTRLRNSDKGASLAEVVDGRLAQHGVDAEKISWDAYRRDDGTWRIVATWPSGKATAQAIWELDKTRQQVTPHDDMAQYLCAERPAPILGQELPAERAGRGLAAPRRAEGGRGELGRDHTRPAELGRGGHEPMRPPADPARRDRRGRGLAETGRGLTAETGRSLGPAEVGREPGHAMPEQTHTPAEPAARGADLIRSGRDALMASLDRPLTPDEPAGLAEPRRATRPMRGGAFDEDPDLAKEVPAVPSLAVLRPRRSSPSTEGAASDDRPRKRLPSWDDVLFGTAPAARESSS
jgi:Protein of unknown function (DUF3071)